MRQGLCNGTVSVRLSVCPSVCPINRPLHAAAADCSCGPTGQYRVSPKSEPLNILQQQPQICSDLNKILHTRDDICYKHYISYKSALTLLKYEFLNNITHKS